jgi:pimeloyl-ACP methyl ester carboxylesterase
LLAQALSLTDTIGGRLAIGMHNAVACTEDLPFMDASAIDYAALANTYLGAQPLEALINSCRVWPPGILDADLRQPLRSNIPFLLLSGGADPVTPPAYAERALRGLSDARHVIVAGNGHGQWNVPCAPRVMAAFLDAGTTRGLDVTCLQNAQRAQPFFLNANGPAP